MAITIKGLKAWIITLIILLAVIVILIVISSFFFLLLPFFIFLFVVSYFFKKLNKLKNEELGQASPHHHKTIDATYKVRKGE